MRGLTPISSGGTVKGMVICLPINVDLNVGDRTLQLEKTLQLIELGNREADYIEIWFDTMTEGEMEEVLGRAHKKVIAVCRGKDERGHFSGSESGRIGRLAAAVRSGAGLVDCGIQTDPMLIDELRATCDEAKAQLIISHHMWDRTPSLEELIRLERSTRELGADIVKIATTARSWSDTVVLFEFMNRMHEAHHQIIALAMGERGRLSRLGCQLLGGVLTYVAADETTTTAPGQWTLSELSKWGLR
ncbi:hypothetical protein CO046_00020 [Candidatus Peregrinibacteria bacterium CG_4_9_14_0_2_um_filter_53_11]|nr:MAG: hypothetical protein CO046_00020 [Candidatus Peregrinibacteria bacterium CG_4_9_14_0_2_um_filter_53_11]